MEALTGKALHEGRGRGRGYEIPVRVEDCAHASDGCNPNCWHIIAKGRAQGRELPGQQIVCGILHGPQTAVYLGLQVDAQIYCAAWSVSHATRPGSKEDEVIWIKVL